MLRLTMAAVACIAALAAAPAAMAQVDDDFDPEAAVDTVTNSLRGGVQQDHAYICDENNATVQDIITGVQDVLNPADGKFKNFATMATYGYFPYADAPLVGLSGGQGHWINPGFIEDGHIMDPQRPESILVDAYNRPIGVMFINDQPSDPTDPSTWGPDMYVAEDGTPCNAWHYHTEILADTYWYAYKYAYSGDVAEGDWQPPNRTPDLMHVWAYGATGENYKYQWNHNTPPRDKMAADMAEHGVSQGPGRVQDPATYTGLPEYGPERAAEFAQELAKFHTAEPEEVGPGPRLPGTGPQP